MGESKSPHRERQIHRTKRAYVRSFIERKGMKGGKKEGEGDRERERAW